MPIVFIHGVAVRADGRPFEDWWRALYDNLRRYIAPVVSKDHPERVTILPAYWGDLGARFWWVASRPLSRLLGKGAEGRSGADDWFEARSRWPRCPKHFGACRGSQSQTRGEPMRWFPRDGKSLGGIGVGSPQRLDPDQLAALTMAAARMLLENHGRIRPNSSTTCRMGSTRSARAASHNGPRSAGRSTQRPTRKPPWQRSPSGRSRLRAGRLEGDRRERVPAASRGRRRPGREGGSGVDRRHLGRLKEAVGRAESAPGYLLTKALTEFRRPANDLVTLFMGDVFAYIDSRTQKDPNRNIALRVLDTIVSARRDPAQAGEPLVLLTHSMGGQIAYDLITEFLPRHPEAKRLRVDFWCATASQVGLFEEMKRFLASTTKYSKKANNQVPYPSREQLGVWWNVWDSNDFISYTARPVFVNYSASPLRYGVIDEEYPTGRSVLGRTAATSSGRVSSFVSPSACARPRARTGGGHEPCCRSRAARLVGRSGMDSGRSRRVRGHHRSERLSASRRRAEPGLQYLWPGPAPRLGSDRLSVLRVAAR